MEHANHVIALSDLKGILSLQLLDRLQNGLDILDKPVCINFRKDIIHAFTDQSIGRFRQETRVSGRYFTIDALPCHIQSLHRSSPQTRPAARLRIPPDFCSACLRWVTSRKLHTRPITLSLVRCGCE